MATADVAALIIRLEARFARFEKALERQRKNTNRQVGMMKRDFASLDRQLARFGRNFGINLSPSLIAGTAAALAFGKTIRDIIRNGDRIKQLEGRFKALTGSIERSRTLIQGAFDIGSETGAPFEAITQAVTRFRIATEQIDLADEKVIELTSNIIKLGQIGGGTATELAAGAIQLGQGLASSRLAGDELRSVLEQMPLVARAIADGLGVNIGQLRALAKEGRLTAEAVTGALLGKTEEINRQFEQLPITLERSEGRLSNAWIQVTAEIDKAISSSETLGAIWGVLADVGEAVAKKMRAINVANEALVAQQGFKEVQQLALARQLENVNRQIVNAGITDRVASTPGTREDIKRLTLMKQQIEARIGVLGSEIAIQDRIDANRILRRGPPRRTLRPAPPFAKPSERPEGLGLIDLRDEDVFKPAKKRTSGRGSKASDQRSIAFLDNLRERILLLGEEVQLLGKDEAAQSRLNASFDKQRTVRDLMALSKEKDVILTEEQIAQALTMADTIEQQTVALEDQRRAQDDAAEADRQRVQTIKDFSSAVTNAIIHSENFNDVLRNIGLSVANLVIQRGAEGISTGIADILGLAFGGGGGGGGGGLAPIIAAGIPSAKGNVFQGGRIVPFAKGGVVSQPTMFPMKSGTGLMAEAGHEGIFPLSRGRGGRLGVDASGIPDTEVNVFNSTGEEARVEQRQENGRSITDIFIGEMDSALAQGDFDGSLKGRFAVQPNKIRR